MDASVPHEVRHRRAELQPGGLRTEHVPAIPDPGAPAQGGSWNRKYCISAKTGFSVSHLETDLAND